MTTTSTPHPMPLTIHNTDFSSADASDAKSDTSDLSDSQISSLLQAAETRLQQRTQKQITTSIQTNSAAAGFPRLDPGQIAKPYVTTENGVAKVDGRRMVPVGKLEGDGVRIVEPIITKGRDQKTKDDAGPQWYNLPATDQSIKKDLQLLKMRGVLDPKRHYKKDSSQKTDPKYAQVGTIIEGPTEFYSARIPKKQRRQTFIEEVLAGERETGRFKRNYNDIQASKTSGKKAHYKALKAKRRSNK